ncbi:MAG: conjugal transfer protein TrbF [Hyphomonas sp.]|uniref:conjugal transfer protein TrbF n=1 Tax=Hyphomonas sp. TaxID=87 RepID=UPI0017AFE5DF|nr:conjugal transfer protein TrbF [Hyphomonas sp.]MBU3919341.1 conjugal transfer protein TrbF [Alphaproteobacteria bacterium]MBA3069128.1 conjugal transfer protein TrbF [Hyphomonas sp.]MBU4061543.1 conjugal transfer protein TrbF [Alphaproteobacteria bacterium]MBU4165401.1 conjugal transfer protein TrbF [Alphaproteobacteria bacterium]MBU4567831.1 conjugal transfer protein TrbF [Alphaproteobacteria bacterium]
MDFRRAASHYGESPLPETPYQKAGQVWDERIGSARVQARNWRLMALALLAALLLTSGALVWRSLQSAVTPYVVEIGADGAVRAVAPALAAFEPSDAQIAHQIAGFVENVRSLSIDPVVVRQNWLKAYDMVTDKAALTLNQYARDEDPFADIGRRSRSVDVISVVRATDTSFEARWLEKTYENGALTDARRFTGHFTLVQDTPRDAETLRANPLGIYILSLNWSEDLVTGDRP